MCSEGVLYRLPHFNVSPYSRGCSSEGDAIRNANLAADKLMVGGNGFEPMTSAMSTQRSKPLS